MSNQTLVNPLDLIAIQNVISRYCEALDSKDFETLANVFTPDVAANYPFNSNLQGIEAVSAAIQKRLGPIRTHHNLTTQSTTFDVRGKAAYTVTYFQGVHFGQARHEGKQLCAYGKYMDHLVLVNGDPDGDCEGVAGASGLWRIKKRVVVFTQRIGDENIMKEY
ncbi:hypothetical protein T440DRAFT_415940 [Plenodomus tracheiphilus IPT5]|uniref:SnoaL-like domain-containing protein n=1 Tax=Plenodomus tracheiphilus IPT5 TaxID=1408161 RepID=A0A6A7BJE4_9PLEO|nr:hypothetical protein T440DRAFT_415940 [Plenodomus tracheiphilus IPT5]